MIERNYLFIYIPVLIFIAGHRQEPHFETTFFDAYGNAYYQGKTIATVVIIVIRITRKGY